MDDDVRIKMTKADKVAFRQAATLEGQSFLAAWFRKIAIDRMVAMQQAGTLPQGAVIPSAVPQLEEASANQRSSSSRSAKRK